MFCSGTGRYGRCHHHDSVQASLAASLLIRLWSSHPIDWLQMYRYGGDGSEDDLVRFMIDEYREVHGEDVPPPPSLLSDLREKLLDFMDEHWTPVCFLLTLGFVGRNISHCCCGA